MIYKALALQTTCFTVNKATNRAEAEAIMKATIERIHNQIRASKAFIGQDLKLVVLPEYFLTGFPMGETMAQWQAKACIPMQGEIYDLLGKVARENGVYLSGNAYELDDNFPDLYFQTSFILDTDGTSRDNREGVVILRYRRLNSMFAPTPHDVWDKYLDVYGYEAVFPTVKTELGTLACIASEEILYPEIARCLMMRGAEIFLHSSSEVGSLMLTQKNVAKLARATENMAYVISANSAGMTDSPIPFASTDGHSQIVNYEGLKLCEAGFGESMIASASIHLEALRHARERVGMSNFIARQRFELYAESYAKNRFYPANNLLDKTASRPHFVETQKRVIEELKNKGVI
jgi:predicted amidohydrolase